MAVRLVDSPLQVVWIFLLCGFLSLYFVFTKANIVLKILLPYLFINCFLSAATWISFTSFVWVTVSAYFYLLCLEIEDCEPVFKTVGCILAVEMLLVVLGALGKDSLYNFGQAHIVCIGSVGNTMQFKSLIIILIAILIQRFQSLRKYLLGIYITLGIVAIWYFFAHKVGPNFMYARGSVWLAALKLSFKHPIVGYGLSSSHAIFSTLATGKFQAEGQWCNMHNFWIQNLFDLGLIGLTLLVGFTIAILKRCKDVLMLGAILVGFTLMFHFPDRMPSCIPLLILFVALIERKDYAIPS